MKATLYLILLVFSAAFAEPVIEDVWFSQDVSCDGQTLIDICYILSGGPANVSTIMSADSGHSWTVPLDSLIGAAGDLGPGVTSGTHCFQWVMSHDLPDTQGDNWMIQAEVVNFLDTFLVIDSIDISTRPHYGWGLGYGLGVFWIYDYTTGYLYYSNGLDPVASPPRDSVYLGDSLNCDIDQDGYFIYYGKSGANPTQIYRYGLFTGTNTLIATVPMHGPSVQGVQVIGDTLYAAYYDNRTYPYVNRMYVLGFDLTRPFPITVWDTIAHASIGTCTAFEGLAYAHGYLWGSNNSGRIIRIDLATRTFAGCYPVPNIGNGAEGLCYDGSYLWYQNRDLNWIWQILITDTSSSRDQALGALDSRGPIVTVTGPDSLIPGDRMPLSWSVFDPNLSSYPYELVIQCGTSTETYSLTDTFYRGIAPFGCDSVTVTVTARDSFCNYGVGVLSIPVASAGLLGHILVQSTGGILYLRVIDTPDAIAAGNGVIMVQLPAVLGAADLVDTTHTWASPVHIRTPYGIRSWRYDTAP